jgi:hypothetical protein
MPHQHARTATSTASLGRRWPLAALTLALPLAVQAVPATGGATFHQSAGVPAPVFLKTGDIVPLWNQQVYQGTAITGGFTAMTWMRPQGTQGQFSELFRFGTDGFGGNAWGMFFIPNSTALHFNYASGSMSLGSFNGPQLGLNDWSLVTLVSDPVSASLRMYLGGTLASTQTLAEPLLAVPGGVFMSGAYFSPASAVLGDFGLWNVALSQAQIARLASPPQPVPEPQTWLMALCGVGIVAAACRYRSALAAAAPGALMP